MSLLNKASLIQIPSGYKDGTLYSAKPTNGDGDFTFSRGSNLAATRVNSDGLIEKGRENLLTYSNDFSQGVWNKDSGASVSSGEVGYDGSNDAWRLTKSSLVGSRIRYTSSITGVHTGSIYVKAGSLEYLKAESFSGSAVCYDLVNGTIVFEGGSGLVDSTIQSAGNGWWRISLTNKDNALYFMLYPADSSAITSGTGSTAGYIYIQDAQLEAGLIATDYIETGASTAQAGILEDMPRLDYSGGASCPSLLLEPSATALNQQSEYYDTYWFKENTTISSNDTTSPEGVANASKINETASTTYFALSKGFTISSGSNHTISVFAKADERNFLIIRTNLLGSNVNTTFNLSTGVVTYNGHTSASIESYSNGWYRCSITASSSSTSLQMAIVISNADVTSNVLPTYLGVAESGLHIYGINVMASGYLQSYIPTYGASVTRSQDIVDGAVDANLFNDDEGVLFVEFAALADTRDNEFRFLISDGTNDERVQIGLQTSNTLYCSVIVSNSAVADFTTSLASPSSTHKVAIRYKSNDFAAYVDGTQIGTDTSGGTPSGLDRLDFYRTPNNNNYVEANVKQTIYFNTALTNDELASLTTI